MVGFALHHPHTLVSLLHIFIIPIVAPRSKSNDRVIVDRAALTPLGKAVTVNMMATRPYPLPVDGQIYLCSVSPIIEDRLLSVGDK
jgi:hypothetical protein